MVCTAVMAIKKLANQFNRDCEVKKVLRKKVLLVGMLKKKFQKRTLKFGATCEARINKNMIQAVCGSEIFRNTCRDRAAKKM